MRQLLLDLNSPSPPSLDTVVGERNGELLEQLRIVTGKHSAQTPYYACIYLWGATGTGKTHILHSLASTLASQNNQVRYMGADCAQQCFEYDPAVICYLIDDCEHLSPTAQLAVFNLFNQIHASGTAYLIGAGALPPKQLPLRQDLCTRLAWGLVYQLHSLTDEEKVDALTNMAQARYMPISSAILSYLLSHYQRDMSSLAHMLERLDRYSLETKRPITLPLLRDLMQQPIQQNEI